MSGFTKIWSPLLLVLGGFLPLPALQGTIFLHLDGIPGESTDAKHVRWIDIESVSSWMTGPFRSSTRTFPASFEDLVLVKRSDAATPGLMEACATGKALTDTIIEITRPTASGQVTYLTYRMQKVLVTSLASFQSSVDAFPSETLSLKFADISAVYRQYDSSGKAIYEARIFWDVLLNEGSYTEESLTNAAPTIEPLGNQSVQPGETRAVALTIGDIDSNVDDLSVTASTDRPDLVKNLMVSGTGSSRSLSFTASNLYSGNGSITVSVSDGQNTSSKSFSVLIDVEMTPFEAFLTAYFTAEEREDALLSSPLGDPDKDGVTTLVEYVMGGNPREFTHPWQLIRIERKSGAAGPEIHLFYKRRADDSSIGPIRWMAPELIGFAPLENGNPLYEESTTGGENVLYEDVHGTFRPDPEIAEALHLFRLEVNME